MTGVHADGSVRVAALGRALREAMGEPGLTVRPWRAGTDFWADLVETDTVLGVVRSPRIERAETSYEGVVDFGGVIAKEVGALRLMGEARLPVPRVLGWRRAARPGELSWLLLSHVGHDDEPEVPTGGLGELVRRLHAIRPRTAELAPPPSWPEFVWGRLRQRLRAARRYCSLPGDTELRGVLGVLGRRGSQATSLLHMDLRPDNICVREGRIVALLDLANCIVGDPLLELGRIRGYGLLDEGFLTGYGCDRFGEVESILLDVYELDTALLLTVVSVEEFHDPALHRAQAARATQLAEGIAGSLAV